MFEIHRLNFGSVRIDASMRVRGVAPGRLIEVPAQGFLVFGQDGPVLVDAGYRDPSVLGLGGTVAPGQGFAEQLAAHGLEAGDLTCVVMTHLHRDHAGHLDKVPMHVPVVVERSELAGACSGIQGRAYAKDDLHHLIDRLHSPGSLHLLDLGSSGPEEVLPGITCRLSGGHTPGSIGIVVPTTDGEAYLCGDLLYDVEGSLRTPPKDGPLAGVQPSFLVPGDPGLTNNFTTSVLQEIGAVKHARRYRFVMPAHDTPGVLDHGRYVGRIDGDVVPGPMTPVGPPTEKE